MKHYLELVRYRNLIIIAAVMFAVRYLVLYPPLSVFELDFSWPLYNFLLLVISTMFLAAGGYAINNYVDMDIDAINVPEKVVVGKHVAPEKALNLSYTCSIIGILIGGWCAYSVSTLNLTFIQILIAGGLYYYSTSFKFQILIGNIVVAICCGLVPMVSGIYDVIHLGIHYSEVLESANVVPMYYAALLETFVVYMIILSVIAFALTLIRELIKDAEDIEGDSEHEVNSFAVRFGARAASIVAAILSFLLVGFIAVLLNVQFQVENYILFGYATLAIQIPILGLAIRMIFAKKKAQFSSISRWLKYIMISGLGYLLLTAIIHLA